MPPLEQILVWRFTEGLSLSAIAVRCGVSRQRVHQVLCRQKHRARATITQAVKHGTLVRPAVCSECGSSGGPIEAHHPDYSQPWTIRWLCRPCHETHKREQPPPRKPLEAVLAKVLAGVSTAKRCRSCGSFLIGHRWRSCSTECGLRLKSARDVARYQRRRLTGTSKQA